MRAAEQKSVSCDEGCVDAISQPWLSSASCCWPLQPARWQVCHFQHLHGKLHKRSGIKAKQNLAQTLNVWSFVVVLVHWRFRMAAFLYNL